MAEIVNLNQRRKARAKAEAQDRAASNRAVHGRTRAEREQAEAERRRASRLLDGARLDKDSPED